MKKTTTPFLTFLILTFILSSCSNYYYSPNDGDMIALRKKNDAHISGGVKNKERGKKRIVNLQAGYSPLKHIALAASYFNISDGYFLRNNGNGSILNGAIGGYYFFPIKSNLLFKPRKRKHPIYPELQMKNGILVDLYLGNGFGKVNNFYTEGGRSHFDFQKKYVQLGFHFIKKNWSISYNLRRGWLTYSKGQVFNRLKIPKDDIEKFQNLVAENRFNLMEHSFRFQIGIKHVRCFFTLTNLAETEKLSQLGVENQNFNVGLIIELDEFFRKK